MASKWKRSNAIAFGFQSNSLWIYIYVYYDIFVSILPTAAQWSIKTTDLKPKRNKTKILILSIQVENVNYGNCIPALTEKCRQLKKILFSNAMKLRSIDSGHLSNWMRSHHWSPVHVFVWVNCDASNCHLNKQTYRSSLDTTFVPSFATRVVVGHFAQNWNIHPCHVQRWN